mgnify:FL=1|jgi:two-component system chemotaxis response regulator CheY
MSAAVLLVSRCQDSIDTLKRGLVACGIKDIRIARNLKELDAMLEDGALFDIAVIHIEQDYETDLQCLSEMHERMPRAAFIVASPYNDADLAIACFERGATDYIAMPFSKDTLSAALKRSTKYKVLTRSRPRFLILEDDPVSSTLMKKYLDPFGDCTLVVDGKEAIETFERAVSAGSIYQLLLLDIMVPEVHGKDVLKRIREIEEQYRVPKDRRSRVIMTSALSDTSNVVESFKNKCNSYLVKPIDKKRIIHELAELGFDTTNTSARIPASEK